MSVCGLDEAGCGPLAGPVYAAAVVLPPDFPLDLLNDSKKLSEARRDKAAAHIKTYAAYGIGFASHTEIDELNILEARLLAMRRAYGELSAAFAQTAAGITEFIVDGLFSPWKTEPPPRALPVTAMPKADAKVPAVMAASILAKTARDAHMRELALEYPQYQFEKHKGYPTALHRECIARFGLSPIHRKTFRMGGKG